MIQKVFQVRERTVVVPGRGKVRRKVFIVSGSGFRELRQEAGFGAAARVRCKVYILMCVDGLMVVDCFMFVDG
jgi:hypothetical protein